MAFALLHTEAFVAGLQRTSEMLSVLTTSPGMPTITRMRIEPADFAAAPFASGVPTVRKLEACCGGAHDGNESGSPCVLFAETHCW